MNRRNFLQSGSLAVLAAAGLPRAVKAFQQPTPSSATYRSKSNGDLTGQWMYEVVLFHKGIEYPDQALPEEKIITLKTAYFETNDMTNPSKKGEYTYKIKDSKLEPDTGSTSTYYITTKFGDRVSGDKLDKSFPKNLKFRCQEYSKVEILDKDGGVMYTLPYPSSTSTGSGSGCFLTTACVEHKGFADDCNELQVLRILRDEHMRSTAIGESLIKNYREIGPEIVNAINSCTNKADIYDYMYENMISPSVVLVNDGRLHEAVEYYKVFVKALKEQYC
jgi:hypothetical protein